MRPGPWSLAAPLLVAFLLAAQPASAQSHEHEAASGVSILSDLGPTGLTYVGAVNHVTIVAHGDDEVPDFHQDMPMRILLDNVTVFELDAGAGHDYDGVRETYFALGKVGHYRVEALDAEGVVLAHVEGDVRPHNDTSQNGSGTVDPNPVTGVDIMMRNDVSGRAPEVRDFIVDVRQAGRITTTAQLRAAEGAVQYHHNAQAAGEYANGLTYFDARPAELQQPAESWHQALVDTVAAGGGIPAPGSGAVGPVPLEANDVVVATGGGLQVIGTYDPWTRVGPDTLQTLGILVLDEATGKPAQNVTVRSRLTDLAGHDLWRSDDGYAPSGLWGFATVQRGLGVYSLHADVFSDGRQAAIDIPYAVEAPVNPASAGLVAVRVAGLEDLEWQVPGVVTLTASAAQAALGHTDILVDIFGPTGATGSIESAGMSLLLRTKVHTHDSGDFRFTFTPPGVGDYTMMLTPTPLEARPIVLGQYVHAFTIVGPPQPEGPPEEALGAQDEGEGSGRPAPMTGPVALAMALVPLAVVVRRR